MFVYEKKLQYPVKITNTNPKLASIIISQYGGPVINKLQSPYWTPNIQQGDHYFTSAAVQPDPNR